MVYTLEYIEICITIFYQTYMLYYSIYIWELYPYLKYIEQINRYIFTYLIIDTQNVVVYKETK